MDTTTIEARLIEQRRHFDTLGMLGVVSYIDLLLQYTKKVNHTDLLERRLSYIASETYPLSLTSDPDLFKEVDAHFAQLTERAKEITSTLEIPAY